MINFIHKNPIRGNIGDYLCSPRHYFEFESGEKEITIVGGGAFGRLGVEEVERRGLSFDQTVVWGVGRSIKREFNGRDVIGNLPFVRWGVRDKDAAPDGTHFLPCASCLHEMLDKQIEGDHTLLFLNADKRVTPGAAVGCLKRFAAKQGWRILFNNCSGQEFYDALRSASSVVTNSFHGAYWALLAGRKVAVAGYSSKFSSLLVSLDLPMGILIDYDREIPQQLFDAVGDAAKGKGFISLDDHSGKIAEFREININFARSLVESGIVSSFRLKADHLHLSPPRGWRSRITSSLLRQ